MSREFFHSDLLIYILMDDPRLEVSLKKLFDYIIFLDQAFSICQD
jgi:hypothetical protein